MTAFIEQAVPIIIFIGVIVIAIFILIGIFSGAEDHTRGMQEPGGTGLHKYDRYREGRKGINLNLLSEKDAGRWVLNNNQGNDYYKGRVKDWDDEFIYIVYDCDDWNNYMDFESVATLPENLEFIPAPENE